MCHTDWVMADSCESALGWREVYCSGRCSFMKPAEQRTLTIGQSHDSLMGCITTIWCWFGFNDETTSMSWSLSSLMSSAGQWSELSHLTKEILQLDLKSAEKMKTAEIWQRHIQWKGGLDTAVPSFSLRHKVMSLLCENILAFMKETCLSLHKADTRVPWDMRQ